MEPFRTLHSRTVVLAQQNIDTDQIIPARFLKITHRAGLGRWLFADWRYQPDGNPRPDFILERPEAQGARVLVAGDNFGCGSSREHAPWALTDWGFRAIISSSIADIFSNNAVKNGLLPVRVDAGFHRRLLAEPGAEVSIDLEHRTVTLSDGTSAMFPLDPFARYCLMNGVDELGFLLGQEEAITRFEEARS
ncbi:3-isopropylmalate dehydratase small subunit [Melittangium boletus]|uniref:3-isopropylmalate dehydratase small subunit n=1 Tax=Melittangium boletus DSM 14713 TaxID=1294270 RepID=A0A250I758_9BACT|nr:3-isopropylmalate dehydratase small subunit [Melittangium boletus]ATB27030.1 3-isopropylmalate dehydratase small subunit [Melittangium boletus DSM 14713]